MPLEDELCDILKKSRIGQGISVVDLSKMTGLPGSDITALERGDRPRDRTEVRALAMGLGLRAEPLMQIALEQWEPVAQRQPTWVETIHGSINGYGVQGYVVHDDGEALLIDTAYNAPAMIEFLSRQRVRLVGICLTHGHADHADGIEQILQSHPAPVYLGAEDVELLSWRPPQSQLMTPVHGQTIAVGRLAVHCLMAPGHTAGGICYRVDDAQTPLCFVGDTLFAGSIGRSNPSTLYQTHLASVRTTVLGLPPAYGLLPGHGPATTVEEELAHNPFYASVP
ncbi:MBL fold metallo-hydrolase [Nitrospira lenta]|uniref:Putative Hydrolase with N-terminal DNA-binding domain n=1 Tax=Nitrospira lenta TaxID=1436998 RepID=A0A330L4E3_9BACT|nr:MBL fold metallo-hydrolase [Nitrospira lenta]SPP64694.1 putative Hydrolase with N-terminal DNA-binding domain [Nitrospira lenta]